MPKLKIAVAHITQGECTVAPRALNPVEYTCVNERWGNLGVGAGHDMGTWGQVV